MPGKWGRLDVDEVGVSPDVSSTADRHCTRTVQRGCLSEPERRGGQPKLRTRLENERESLREARALG